MEISELKRIIEAALLAADDALTVPQLQAMFSEEAQPSPQDIRRALTVLDDDCADRGVELREVASGFRLQVKMRYQPFVEKLWEERPPRYSKALLETLAIIAYRQPVTRSEIEEVRGVSVSSHMIRTLTERDWIRVVGHRDLPGKPALFGTTKDFLNYFDLKSLQDLPGLPEIREIAEPTPELPLDARVVSSRSSEEKA